MRWSCAFLDLVLAFGQRVAETGEMPIEEALLTSTPLYLNLGLDRSFDPNQPVWQEFLAGYRGAEDPLAWAHVFYLAHARDYPDAPYSCFAYHYESETWTIRFHFSGYLDVSGFSSLSSGREPIRRQELSAMFAAVKRELPEAQFVRGRSWAYNLAAYRRLFPPEYVNTAVPVEPEFQFMSLWGQFLDRHWDLRQGPAQTFRERFTAAQTSLGYSAAFLCLSSRRVARSITSTPITPVREGRGEEMFLDRLVPPMRMRHDNSDSSLLGLTVAAFIFDEDGRVLLIRENYGQRRYGPPGGRVEAGESPRQAVVREVSEEVGVEIEVAALIGMYYFADEPWLALSFRCSMTRGQPAVPASGEIAEIGWFDPHHLPSPLTDLAPRAIPDAVSGAYGFVRDYPHR